MIRSKSKSLIQEKVVSLFLRLNGYFQTGYISHSSSWGSIGAEIDRIAIRFPNHKQPERAVLSSPHLKIPPNSIDIIIAEVKNKKIAFNDSLKGKNAKKNWRQTLQWLGIFEEKEIKILIPKLINISKLNGKKINNEIQFIEHINIYGKITLRPILFTFEKKCYPEHSKWWVDGLTMIEFLWSCFCPQVRRNECSTVYPIEMWGSEYTEIVRYFKNRHKKNLNYGDLDIFFNNFL